MRVRCADKKNKPDDALIKEIGPLLLDSLRAQLEAYPERRNQERVAWPHSVRATFLLADDKPGETLEGRGKDISLGGMGLYLPRAPAGSKINLELLTPARRACPAVRSLRPRAALQRWMVRDRRAVLEALSFGEPGASATGVLRENSGR